MTSPVIEQLERFGPDRCDVLTVQEARQYTHRLVHQQYENFSVLSRLVPRDKRDDFAAVYAFCRWADDLGDETGDRQRALELLAWWRRELADCYAGQPRHPVFITLCQTIARCDIPADPFEHLIDAFEQDQRIDRYQNWEQVLDYCRRSADPVGRLVLYLFHYRDEQRQQISDATCTALQLTNFWQDVRRDILERDRIYLPADALAERHLTHDDLAAHARGEKLLSEQQMDDYRQVVRDMVERTWPLFKQGRALWPRIDRSMRLPVQLFTLGGETVLKKIARDGYDTLNRRPALSKLTKVCLMGRVMTGRWFSVGV